MTGENSSSGKPPGRGGGLAIAGLGVLMVACCAGPVLIAGGALGALGAAVRIPWLIATGVLVVLAVVVYTLRRRTLRRSAGTGDDCCSPRPPDHTSPPAHKDHTRNS